MPVPTCLYRLVTGMTRCLPWHVKGMPPLTSTRSAKIPRGVNLAVAKPADHGRCFGVLQVKFLARFFILLEAYGGDCRCCLCGIRRATDRRDNIIIDDAHVGVSEVGTPFPSGIRIKRQLSFGRIDDKAEPGRA